MFGPKNVFVSGLVCITRVDVSLLEKVHVLIVDFCRKNCLIYIDNKNIKSDSLYKDKGKAISTTLYQGGGKNMLTSVSCLSHMFGLPCICPKVVDSYSIFSEIEERSNLICLFGSVSLKLNTHSIIAFICIRSIDALHIMNKL